MNNRLLELRKEKGWSQQSVADEIGIGRVAYRKWEDGTNAINSDSLINLSKLYDVSIDYLLGISDYRRNENENICKELGLSEKAVDRIKGEVIRLDDGGSFINHEVNNDLLNLFLESEHGIELLNAIGGYVDSIEGKNAYMINRTMLTDVPIEATYSGDDIANCLSEDVLLSDGFSLKEFIKHTKTDKLIYFPHLNDYLENSAKERISKALYELKKEYKEREGKHGNNKKEK